MDPNRHTRVAQLAGTPRRGLYGGGDLRRAKAIADLRERCHRCMPRFVLEYLEGGAEDEATLARERSAYACWRFLPRTLVDVSNRSVVRKIFGRAASAPVVVAPTGLNGIFRRDADALLAQGAAKANLPFVQSTMSNASIDAVARTPGLRHWFQLYVFGDDHVWRSLVRRAEAAGCEALVLTTNSQIYGNREWDARTRATRTRPSIPTILNAALHPNWWATTLIPNGLPEFANVREFAPRGQRGFFETAFWVRDQMWRSLSWDTVASIRAAWPRRFIVKGLLHPEDLARAKESGVDGVVLSAHGGRQLDWSIAPLEMVQQARSILGDHITLFAAGGIRRGTDVLKAIALGADAVFAGRAPLYGLCAYGAPGVTRALEILQHEAHDALGLMGRRSLDELGPDALVPSPEIVGDSEIDFRYAPSPRLAARR